MNLNDVQRHVLSVVAIWSKTEKTPIAQRIIVSQVIGDHIVKESTVKAAVRVLVKKGYIRKSVTTLHGASYVQLRSI